ncbi:hypothetical protein A2Y85_05000 [candidate division WOR-3 bacterium RBG_13_43_14]|uniref:PTS EIIB type-4 domain-containing protein n=1 Tax=candidate division WOR-3 bacterium RBG_13_43_14 TaxID=1802590 RepID=A0A1F4UEV3_UNCW3|nr:MAG: hypothetical protein A2Y85_05000 [candidate division WOR-3 bacterium RBG_13_43_14]
MKILRIDDRLIHGQVVAGWVRPLGIQVLVLASDDISQDEWACTAYSMAIPEGIKFLCVSIAKCTEIILSQEVKRTMIVVGSVPDAHELIKYGLPVKEITIGGLSYREGTREISSYIYFAPEDIVATAQIYNMGIKVIGKQLPNSSPIDIVKVLAGVKQ